MLLQGRSLPASLINKPARLDAAEWELMRGHPEQGVALLRETHWTDPTVIEITHAHHERLDGSGYPRGLSGAAVPLGARIVAICDAYDAMTTDRAYQAALRGIDAFKIIKVNERGKYDDRLVDRFVRAMVDPASASFA